MGLTVAPSSAYLFDSSNTALGRVSYVTKGADAAGFFKSKAKKGPFKLEDFQDKFRYQLQDEHQAFDQAQDAASKQLETEKPPDPKNMQAFTEYMGRIQSMQGRNMMRLSLDMYQPNLYGSPTVYVLEERQIGQRTYPTRYVVLYQDQALRQPGYRLVWMTVTDEALKVGASRVFERRAAGPRSQEGRCGCEEKGRGARRVDEEKGRGGKEQIQEGSGRSRKRAGILQTRICKSYCRPGTDLRLAVPCRSISSTTGPSAFLGSNRTGIRSTMSFVSGTAAMYGILSDRFEQRAIRM